MSRALEPMAVLVGTTLFSYCLWQLFFDPFRGPLPGRVIPIIVLGGGVVTGVGLITWGLRRLDVLNPP